MNSLWQNVRSTRFVVVFTLAISLLSSFNAFAAPDGKALFKGNCASCHNASSKKSTGPGLMGVLDRIPSKDWAHDWVHDNNALRAKGDAYANNIFKQFSGSPMSTFPKLTNEEIDAILDYVNPGPDEPKAPVAAANGGGAAAPGSETDAGNPWFLIIIILILLIAIIAVLRYTKINLRNAYNDKEGLPEEEALTFLDASRKWVNDNKKIVAVIGVFLFCVLVVKGWYALKGIGVYAEEVKPDVWVGYHPSQPINFSHKIHAGDNGIQCQYCHSGVEKSKTAGIPPAMVCMNCHKVIDQNQAGTEESKKEIAKIYFAVGWDPEKRVYTGETHPIQWNKVHVLPDHVFFSHQQHVVVGKQDCANCHGDVKTMGTVEQQRPLTMGWCINCHRTTPVAMDGNGYYEALHNKMKEKYKDQPITVSMVGGIECARCHY
jgi:cytochrome c2